MVKKLNNHVRASKNRRPFALAEDPELSKADRSFLCRIMKLDPRDRPTAKELLMDEWFNKY